MRQVITTGKSVEEATENACRELGLSRDEVSVEILEMPIKKLFKSLPAKVKVTVMGDEEEIAPAKHLSPEEVEKPAAKKEAVPKTAPGPKAARAEKPADKLLPQEPEEAIDLAQNERARAAVTYLMEIITAMGAEGDAEVTAVKQGDATLLRVTGESINDKMEIRGETIQALSYLIDRAVNTGIDKKESEYVRIRLDIAGYRNRRETELMALAQRTGKEVAQTGRSRTLAPMNPYERLIVHTAISQIEGIASESIGSDVDRRVVVKSLAPNATEGEDWRPPSKDRERRGGGARGGNYKSGARSGERTDRGDRAGNRPGGGSRGRDSLPRGGKPYDGFKPTNTPEREYADKPRDLSTGPIVPQQREAIRDGEDLPLYGKIKL